MFALLKQFITKTILVYIETEWSLIATKFKLYLKVYLKAQAKYVYTNNFMHTLLQLNFTS